LCWFFSDNLTVVDRIGGLLRFPQCTAFFVNSKGSRNNIALTAGHCVSDSRNTFILDINNYGDIDKDSIICCAYDRALGEGFCPRKASYKIITYGLLSTYHNGGHPSHDMAVVSTRNSAEGRIPGKWSVNNWDPNSGKQRGDVSRVAAAANP
jgi:hypothetical protein